MNIKSDKPYDYSGQVWRGIDDKFPKKIHNATATSDGLMSAEDKAKLDSINLLEYDRVYDVASWETDGLLSKEDKFKLDGIEQNANNYIHPNNENIRHVTDEQIEYWDAKASTDIATQTVKGLMSADDKKKLDNIEEKANNYIHPDTELIRHVTDKQIKYWNEKASTDVATQDKDGLMSVIDKIKLDGLKNYVHPNNEGIRHVSDAEKDYWNSKADKYVATNSEDGLMPFEDKIKLDGIEAGANNYVHPNDENTMHVTAEQIKYWDSKSSSAPATYKNDGLMSKEDKIKLDNLASMDTDLADRHFVSAEEKEYWNSKAENTVATTTENGLLSAEDKVKLDSLENYIHPDDENTRHVSDEQISRWDNKANNLPVNYDSNGLMIAADKTKLDGIEEGANNYVHPDDENTKHVTIQQINMWTNKADNTPATESSSGLMSAEDKVKLDSLENYIHPEIHPATMIEEDETHRFVTDEEKERWNEVITTELATPESDGLMSAEDKDKLDRLVVPKSHELPLIYSEWSENKPYLQTITVPGLEPDTDAYIGINTTATIQEMEAAVDAQLKIHSVEQDTIVIEATDVKPTIDIPLVVMVGSNIMVFNIKEYNGVGEYLEAAPTEGYHYQNEIIYSSKPVQTNCIGWVCIEDGEPGVWKSFGEF